MEMLSEYLKSVLAEKSTAVSYAIMHHGKLVASDAIGVINQKDNVPVTTKCTFNVASISKIYVTVAIMQLVEQGKITLDDKVYEILPDFTMKDERYKDITVHMLIDHSCALPGTQWKHFSLSKLDGVDYYEDVYHYLSTHHLKADPGSISVYCNDGFTVAEMVVAKVSGMKYEDYVQKYITDPIGAYSTRLSPTINPEYPLVVEGKKPQELLWIMGAAGVTTNMEDLCKFGQLFLEENEIISEKSKQIMAEYWGKTFLKGDRETEKYGLGWDDVNVQLEEYDLGDHVLTKGGNSFYFFSRLFIIPEYDAVVAMSATHDTKIDTVDESLRLFALYMDQIGEPIYTYGKPQEDVSKYTGYYYDEFAVYQVKMLGNMLVLYGLNDDKKFVRKDNFFYKDGKWSNIKNDTYYFEEGHDSIYLMHDDYRFHYPSAQKPNHKGSFNEIWKKRIGNHYIVCDATPYDLVITQWLAAVTFDSVEDGIIPIFAHYRKDGANDGSRFNVMPKTDYRAEGFLDVPWNGSRDLVDPEFYLEDGKEYLEMASYHYINSKDVKEYANEDFPEGKVNGVYHVTDLKEVKPVEEGHRIILLNEDFSMYWDSLDEEEFKKLDKGYMILV